MLATASADHVHVPEQIHLVSISFNGPARTTTASGVAGSGFVPPS
jgi:hypothetical protein